MSAPNLHAESLDSAELQALFDSIAAVNVPRTPPPSAEAGDSDELQALFDSVAATVAPPPAPVDETGDSNELQALFDSVAAVASPPPPPAAASGDSDELQALFDSVASAGSPVPTPGPERDDAVFNRLGQLARQLHDSLHGLGMDKLLEDNARQIPDARDRLDYIARMTEQAASRVLNATDVAKPIQDRLIERSTSLGRRWEDVFGNRLSGDEFKQLAGDTRSFFAEAPGQLKLTNDQLMEIILAQDFQDLTGQVIKKTVELVQGLESQLLAVLIEAMPPGRRAEAPETLINGPVINAAGRSDVVNTQAQVDDLLESLGF